MKELSTMKELSIEEKAKRYDEAIERAYSLLNGERKGDAWIHKLLPELAESEEEKLSKKLHECVCRAINNDKLPYEERKYISEQVIPYLENLEKQKEQKPQSKQEWSEEDEDRVKTVLYILHEVADNYNFDEWLKSLKDRVIPQTKQEWSEESEIMLDRLIKHFNKNDFDRGYEVGVSAAKFNQWKPTEEQMKALKDAAFDAGYEQHFKEEDVLESLIEDLEKL